MNDLPIDKLGPYPLLQLAAGIAVLMGIAFAVYRGVRDRRPPDAKSNEQRYFFNGPIGEALNFLRDIRNQLNEIRTHVEPLGESGRNINRVLEEIKDEVKDVKEIKTTRRRT